jgi:hypothetical protein
LSIPFSSEIDESNVDEGKKEGVMDSEVMGI